MHHISGLNTDVFLHWWSDLSQEAKIWQENKCQTKLIPNITVSRRLQTLDFFSSSLISFFCGFLSHGFFCSLAKNKTKEVCCVLWWEELGRAAGGTNTRSHIRFWSDPETCTDRMTDQKWLFIIIFTESTFSGAYGWQFTTFSSLSVQSCRRHLE